MRRKIGTIWLPEKNMKLTYFLLVQGLWYGLSIEGCIEGERCAERCEKISTDREAVLRLGKAILRGAVLPGYLGEIAAEWEG